VDVLSHLDDDCESRAGASHGGNRRGYVTKAWSVRWNSTLGIRLLWLVPGLDPDSPVVTSKRSLQWRIRNFLDGAISLGDCIIFLLLRSAAGLPTRLVGFKIGQPGHFRKESEGWVIQRGKDVN
jgi:hypothetical protein